jgi:flagellar biosynthesis anti-sigma factor FlgM
MRIEGNPGAQPAPESERTNNSQGGATSSAASASASTGGALGEDQAQLSGAHGQVQALVLAAQATQTPEIRQEKVNALRQVVESGSYRPSSSQVAGALFDHMMEAPAA